MPNKCQLVSKVIPDNPDDYKDNSNNNDKFSIFRSGHFTKGLSDKHLFESNYAVFLLQMADPLDK